MTLRYYTRKNRLIIGIVFLGFLFRIASIGLANFYHENPIFYIGGDTFSWVLSFDNLISSGTYTINFDSEYGYFGRMPGYTFYIGIFYFLSGMKWDIALQLVFISQIILDTFAIYLVYQISQKVFSDNRTAILNSFLYATYPFILIWNPIVFSEASSVFFLILSIWFLLVSKKKYHLLLVGISISVSALMRPQVICIFPLLLIVVYHLYKENTRKIFLQSLLYSASVLMVYGAWPARNYFLHDKLIITQDIRGFYAWDTDINAFMKYLYSVDTSWEPSFSNITFKKTHVRFPGEAYKIKTDSILLESTIYLCRTCGRGFSYWKEDFNKTKVITQNCNAQIETNFEKLKKSQQKNNPVNYYIILPLKNLNKALFKIKLTNTDNRIKKMASLLFVYRSILIFLGLSGIVMLLVKRKENTGIAFTFLIFFLSVYGLLCFGPTDQMRNIEMRYFLHADILLLFFAGYFIVKQLSKNQKLMPLTIAN